MARSRTLVLDTKVNVTGADQLRGLGRTLQRTGSALTAGLTLPIIGMGAAMLTAAEDAAKAQAKLTNVFDSMGAAAFTTVEALNAQAEALQSATTFDDESITEFQSVMLTFGNVTGEAFDRAVEAGLDMSALLGQDLQTSAIQLGKALNDPIKGITALTRVGVSFTDQQKEQIRTLTQSGDVLGAQTVILDELERQFGGTAEALAGTAGGQMTQALNQLGEASEEFGKILAPVLVKVAQGVKDFAKFLQDLNPETKEAVIRFGALAAALGPVLIVFGSVLRVLAPFGRVLAPLAGVLGRFSRALGISRLALLGWIGAITAAGVAVGEGYKDVLDQLGSNILRDFTSQHGIAADKVEHDAARIAEALGVTIPEAQQRLLAEMDGNADLYDESVQALIHSTDRMNREVSDALIASEGAWEDYHTVISDAMFGTDGAVPIIGQAVDDMADEMGTAPGRMADELLAAQFHLTDATTQLVNFMEQALSPAQERFQIQGFLASQELANALTSNNPLIRQKADEMQQAAIDRLAEMRAAFWESGASAGNSFASGLADPAVLRFVSNSAYRLAQAARGVFPHSEPDDPRSPLRGITKGFGFGAILAKGFLSGQSAVQGAMRSLVGGGLSMPALSGAGGGGATVVNNFYLQWDGEPPKGRNEAEIIANLQRLSPLAGGKLAAGY